MHWVPLCHTPSSMCLITCSLGCILLYEPYVPPGPRLSRTKMSFIWMLCQKKTVWRFWCASAGSGQEEELILRRAHMHACVKIHIYCRHLNVHIFHGLQVWRKTKIKKTHFAQFVLCPPAETFSRTHAHTHALPCIHAWFTGGVTCDKCRRLFGCHVTSLQCWKEPNVTH